MRLLQPTIRAFTDTYEYTYYRHSAMPTVASDHICVFYVPHSVAVACRLQDYLINESK